MVDVHRLTDADSLINGRLAGWGGRKMRGRRRASATPAFMLPLVEGALNRLMVYIIINKIIYETKLIND